MAGQETGFGALLRRHRGERGWSQEDLAARAGLTFKAIGALERGERRQPYPHTVQALADALALSTEERAALMAAVPKRGRPLSAPGAAADAAESGPVSGEAAATTGGPPAGPSPLHALPVPLDPLVGRAHETAAVVALLREDGARLVTLTGPGGVGKTCLALHVGVELRAAFPDGVAFVDLTPLTDPDLVLPAIARGLGLSDAGAGGPALAESMRLTESLRVALKGRRLLLVLDNVEQVVAAAPAIGDLLMTCPEIAALATSRIALQVRGEHVVAVPPLAPPDAAALLVERARAAAPAFAPVAADAAVIAAICARVDGLPLALELAAPRLKVLSPQALLEWLDSRLATLVDGPRDLPARQRTLRATLEWSHDLLDPDERVLFRRLAVFAGGGTLEAVAAVCGADGDRAVGRDAATLRALSSLADKNMARVDPAGGPRVSLLETIREFAAERLAESGEEGETRRRHARYYLALAERAEPEVVGPRQDVWLARLEREHDNLRAALRWAIERDEGNLGLRAAAALTQFWFFRGYPSEGRRWLEEALGRGDAQEPSARAKALLSAGWLAWAAGDYAGSEQLNDAGLALARHQGDPASMAAALSHLGSVALLQAAYQRARTLFAESLALQRRLGDHAGTAFSLQNLALVEILEGAYERASGPAEESLALSRAHGLAWVTAVALNTLGLAALHQGAYDRAAALCTESLRMHRELWLTRGIVVNLHALACLAAARGAALRAAHLWGAAESAFEALGPRLSPAEHAQYDRYIDAARAQLGKATWDAAVAQGRTLALDDAIAVALDGAHDLPAET